MPFKVGDRVRVINYGSIAWAHGSMIKTMKENYNIDYPKPETVIKVFKNGTVMFDQSPHRIGVEDTISEVCEVQGKTQYSLTKSAWYNDDQLELIND